MPLAWNELLGCTLLEDDMSKLETMTVRLPRETETEVRALAQDAGIKPEQVIALALAVDMRRWNRESSVRAERDELLVFAKEAAMGAYKPKELQKRAQAVIAQVQPNAKLSGGGTPSA